MKRVILLFAVAFFIAFIWIQAQNNGKKETAIQEESQAKLTVAQKDSMAVAETLKARQRKARDLFGFGNGESRKLSRAIKKTMNDPDSYEHVQTVHEDKGDYFLVQTKFRGSNAYGAKVINTITVKMDIDGNVLEVIE